MRQANRSWLSTATRPNNRDDQRDAAAPEVHGETIRDPRAAGGGIPRSARLPSSGAAVAEKGCVAEVAGPYLVWLATTHAAFADRVDPVLARQLCPVTALGNDRREPLRPPAGPGFRSRPVEAVWVPTMLTITEFPGWSGLVHQSSCPDARLGP